MTLPALTDLHPSHLQLSIPVLQRGTIQRLQACRRLGNRLAALLPLNAAYPATPPETADRLALRPRMVVERAGARMGALIYGKQLARYVDAASLTLLESSIGVDEHRFGIREAARGQIPLPTVPTEQTPSDLAAAIVNTGWSCLARWRDIVSTPYQPLATLRLPAAGLPAPASSISDAVIIAVIEALDIHV